MRRLWADDGHPSCTAWLSWRIGVSPGAAREKVRVARALGELPKLDAAFGRGEISYSKARALTRVATPANEERLEQLARDATASQLERICRGIEEVQQGQEREGAAPEGEATPPERFLRRTPGPGDTVIITAQVLADEADLVFRALDLALDELRARKVEGESLDDCVRSDDGEESGTQPRCRRVASCPGRRWRQRGLCP